EVVGVGAGPVVALGVPLVEAADLEGFGVGVLEGDGEQPAVFFFAVLVAEDEPHLPDLAGAGRAGAGEAGGLAVNEAERGHGVAPVQVARVGLRTTRSCSGSSK